MAVFDTGEDRWGSRNGVLRLAARLIGFSFFAYLMVEVGAFTGAVWVAVLSAAALSAAFALALMRAFRGFDRSAVIVCAVMMIAGALINPSVQNVGTVFFVIGGIMLLGQPELPVRVSVGLCVLCGVLIVAMALLTGQHLGFLLSDAFGAVAVVLFGLNRRQRVIRLRQESELAARSAELEQRNAELLAQTEQTRREAARVAALQERGRIARDLHDVLAHSLGGLVVQLDAAEAEFERGHQDRAAERLRASRRLAVEGLHEARAAVAELRTDDADPVVAADRVGSAPASSAAGPETDRPRSAGSEVTGVTGVTGVDLVETLAPVLRGPVGLHLGVDLDVVGDQHPVRSVVGQAMTAVCREALTNVNKHATGGGVSVTVAYRPEEVTVEVVNRLPDRPADTELSDTGAQAGLAGLRERLRLVGGTVTAGPEGRRWVLAAHCPSPYAVVPGPAAPPEPSAAT